MASFAMPSFGSGADEPASGPSEETQGYYRLLGLAEDADYDEINASYERLSEKYTGQTKMVIKLGIAKDKILEDRLRQRLSGSLKGVSAERAYDSRATPKKPLITIPPFMQSFVELPTRQVLLKNAAVFGVIGLLPALTLSWASTSVGLGFAVALYLLYNRGVPQSEMMAEMRVFKARPLVLATGITVLCAMVGATLSQVLFGMVRGVAQELWISICTCGGYFVAATLFKVQDE